MNIISHLIDLFGSRACLAKAAERDVRCVSDWKSKGYIPKLAEMNILKNAQAMGVEIDSSDFYQSNLPTGKKRH